jgi:CubicO group peptidase (beta-lactamase class C family)
MPGIVAQANAPSYQIAAFEGDRIVWSRAFGADTSTDHLYMNGSVTKVVDAIAVLLLVEQRTITLDTDAGDHLPFPLRHPDFPEQPITVGMLLAHRSGLGNQDCQFGWDTGNAYAPRYAVEIPQELAEMSPCEYLQATLTPGHPHYLPELWASEPGARFRYSNTGYKILKVLVEQVTGERYPDYVKRRVFDRAGMVNSGYSAAAFSGRIALPHTRIDGTNIELPLSRGNSYFMYTTAEDQARLMMMMFAQGTPGRRLLQPESMQLMQELTTRFRSRAPQTGRDVPATGYGMGLYSYQGGWCGFGGSMAGYLCLLRYHPVRRVGYAIMVNVNRILRQDDESRSIMTGLYSVQDALISLMGEPGTMPLSSRK